MNRTVFVIIALAMAPAFAESKKETPWSRFDSPAKGKPEVVGSYSNGCLIGGAELPAQGPGYQSIRRYRKRYFGHPRLVRFVETLASDLKDRGFPDILVGDMSQVRGGPLPYGHRSHQLGLDVDLWFTKPIKKKRNDDKYFKSLVDLHKETIDRSVWTERIPQTLKTAADHPQVARIFVHWVIKNELCKVAGDDRDWLRKIRPWWGPSRHFHVRLKCPEGSATCVSQAAIPAGDGCGKEAWFSAAEVKRRKKRAAKKPPKKKRVRKPKVLPRRCKRLLENAAGR